MCIASITEMNIPKNKLSSNFERPYIIEEEIRSGIYRLRRQDSHPEHMARRQYATILHLGCL